MAFGEQSSNWSSLKPIVVLSKSVIRLSHLGTGAIITPRMGVAYTVNGVKGYRGSLGSASPLTRGAPATTAGVKSARTPVGHSPGTLLSKGGVDVRRGLGANPLSIPAGNVFTTS